MLLRLIREPTIDGATLGSLFLDGVWNCWTLEDALRDVKLAGETAIPAGRYGLVLDPSARFHRLMPHVLDVPGFEGIRIHAGNTTADTEGCILVGQTRGKAQVLNSMLAFGPLFDALKRSQSPITVAIENPVTA